MNRHAALIRKLAEIDGIIAEAASLIQKPIGNQPNEQVRAAKVLEEMELARATVEAELSDA